MVGFLLESPRSDAGSASLIRRCDVTDPCADAKAELKAAESAYYDSLRSKARIENGEHVPASDLKEFEEAFRRREAAEQRVKDLCS